MAKKSYSEQLLDPRWQKKRLKILDRAEFHCEYCGDGDTTLHVHHKHYLKGREVWQYDNDQLVCLCKVCHMVQHEREELFFDLIARIPVDGPKNIDEIYFLIAGYIGHDANPELQCDKNFFQAGKSLYEVMYG